MAESLIVQPTRFPRFDTFAASREGQNERSEHRTRDFSFATNGVPRPSSKDALIQSYSEFLASYTGQHAVAYQYTLRTNLDKPSEVQIIQAKTVEESTVPVIEKICRHAFITTDYTNEGDEIFDFGLELLADVDQFESIKSSSFLDCVSTIHNQSRYDPFLVQYHAMEMSLSMEYDAFLMDEEYADAAFKLLVNHISRTEVFDKQETRLSLLNHPPSQQPLPLSHLHGDETLASLLHSGFLRTSERHPGRHALDYRSETAQFTLTYRQLDDITTSLAHKLRSSIPRPSHPAQTIVPAYMEASAAFYISWLAVLKAGFAFCPLPVSATALELQHIIEDACAVVVLTDGPMLSGRPWDAWYCDDDELSACFDINEFITNWMQISPIPERRPLPSIAETDLAYVMYSSSSTGLPIGVKMSHLAASCAIASHCKHIPSHMCNRGFRWLQSAPLTSDVSTLEIFTTWWTGGTLCSVSKGLLFSDMTTAINRVSATITTVTANVASTIYSANTPSLRQLWCTGKPFSSSLLERLAIKSHTPYRSLALLHLYTPLSCSMSTAVLSVDPAVRSTIIGSPHPTTSLLLIDPLTKSPVPIGAFGDLYISGPQLSSGFLNRPDLDATHFCTSSTYGRLYKTYERGRLVKDQNGEFVVEVLRGEQGIEVEVKEEESADEGSVTSMVDSFTEAGVVAEDKEMDVTEANVLSLIGRLQT
ncbi:acetyl-CoA synthetase-like protein [Aureobasidium subglaciale]|nr:acetyl-CoA synthetase-like protein [Aureobasidium subglaciale]